MYLVDGHVGMAVRHIDDEVCELTYPTTPTTVVMLQYTSGTTGQPKGVLLRHQSLVNVAKLTLRRCAAPAGVVCLNPLPMFHTAGCVIAMLGPLWVGGTVVLVDRFSPVQCWHALRAEKVSMLFYVPAVLKHCWKPNAPAMIPHLDWASSWAERRMCLRR